MVAVLNLLKPRVTNLQEGPRVESESESPLPILDLSVTPVSGVLNDVELASFNTVCSDVTGSDCGFAEQNYF